MRSRLYWRRKRFSLTDDLRDPHRSQNLAEAHLIHSDFQPGHRPRDVITSSISLLCEELFDVSHHSDNVLHYPNHKVVGRLRTVVHDYGQDIEAEHLRDDLSDSNSPLANSILNLLYLRCASGFVRETAVPGMSIPSMV